LFASFGRIRSLASSATSPELLQARSELEATLRDLATDTDDLAECVKAIEQDPYRYGLEIDEVARRRRVVAQMRDEIAGMWEELGSASTAAAASAAGRGQGMVTASTAAAARAAEQQQQRQQLPPPSAFEPTSPGDADFAAYEQQRQLEMLQEQDEALDGVSRTVGNLRQQAHDMGRELEEQAELLSDVDKLADRVGNRLQSGAKRMGSLLKRNEGEDCGFPTLFSCFILAERRLLQGSPCPPIIWLSSPRSAHLLRAYVGDCEQIPCRAAA
jgi:t-SNARE syntaxin family protein